MDWYGTAKAVINASSQTYKDLDKRIDEENQVVNFSFSINTEETVKELILKENHVEGTIPELNGYAPIEVTYTGSNATFNYDEETKVFTIDRSREEGRVQNGISQTNSYGINVKYPLEAYQSLGKEMVELKIPVETYYEGYNNPNEEFSNPYKSNVAKATIVASIYVPVGNVYTTSFKVTVGKYLYTPTNRYIVSKQKPIKIYNGTSSEEKDDTYVVQWRAYVGTKEELKGIVMKETKDGEAQVTDQFIKIDSSLENMEDVVTNVGIYFSGAQTLLGDEGWIKVYDEETGNLLETFTKADWGKYTENNPYKYEVPVKHIRIETSDVTKNEVSFYVYNIKEIDDEKLTNKYTKEEFDNLKYIKSNLVGYIAEKYIATSTHKANYETPLSIAKVNISKSVMSTQETDKNNIITIQTECNESANEIKWTNGAFLLKMPKEILDLEINNININNSSVSIDSYEIIEKEDCKFIKIITSNSNPQSYKITVDVNITPDPRIASTNTNIELYASNEEGTEYYYKSEDIYDVNDNLNTTEMVNKTTTEINLVAPNGLLTNQIISDYDENGSFVLSPQVAEVKPHYAKVDNEEKTAKVGIQLTNNYSSTVSEILVLGKIPFEGNTYVIKNDDLESRFTVKMANTGIEVPKELEGKVTVYYSENENTNKDLNDTNNNWKTASEVENWDNIRTYLIDFEDTVLNVSEGCVFYYTIKIPIGVEFNKETYSHHGVYFSLDTDEGKYRTQTEPNKVGIRIAEKYNLELTKYQIGKDKLVSGATYKITEEGKEEGKTAVTNEEGKLIITGIYAEKVYEIKEIKTPSDYELNSEIVRFIGHVDENGTLTIEKLEGTIRDEFEVIKEKEDYKAIVKVEDEIKAKLKLTKLEKGTDIKVSGAKFKLLEENLTTEKILTTNTNGEILISGLKINEEYTLEETKAEGYYLASSIKFKIENNNGKYEYQIIDGEVKESSLIEENDVPIINMTIEDEKIPTYDLEIVKIKKVTEVETSNNEGESGENQETVTYLSGAKFKLYKDGKELGEYITDENGEITIKNLYQYEKEKDLNQTYILKEVIAPDGYAKVKDITFKVEDVEGLLEFQEETAVGQTKKFYESDSNKVVVTIEDNPSFKLIKKDAETKLPIANVKFAIYNVDNEDEEKPAKNSKGEILGTKENINGKEYYTVTTDLNGEITADLTEGLYKAVEVEAPEKYDIIGQTYYFGIGASREGDKRLEVTWAKGIINGSVASTSDGGYIAGGNFYSNSIDLGNGVILNNNGSCAGMIVKYDADGEIEWAKVIGGDGSDCINSVASTSDGGYIAGGSFSSSTIDLGNGVVLNNNGANDGMIIKYDADGEIEWAKGIGGSSSDYINSVASTSDGGYIVRGYFYSSNIDLGNGVILSNNNKYQYGMLIKYDADGGIEWAKGIGGSINSVASTSDGGYIAGGSFYSNSIDLGNGIILNNNGGQDGMIIKYDTDGEIEWAKGIGGSDADYISSVVETSE